MEREEANFTVREALQTSPFWLLTIATGLRIVILSAINVHYVPIMVWKGLSEQRAAFLLGVQAFMSVPCQAGWQTESTSRGLWLPAC